MSEGNKTFRLERRFEKAYDTADLLVPISPIKKDTLFPYTEMWATQRGDDVFYYILILFLILFQSRNIILYLLYLYSLYLWFYMNTISYKWK